MIIIVANCSSNEFECADGNCIMKFEVCNHINDCGDNSDEDHCNNYGSYLEFQRYDHFYPIENCSGDDWYKCDNGQCVLEPARCDDFDDCTDGSDEKGCGM